MNTLRSVAWLVVLLLAGCALPALSTSRPAAPQATATAPAGTLTLDEGLTVIGQALVALVQLHVDQPDPSKLLDAAWAGVVATRLGRGATDFSATSTDMHQAWARFRAAYTRLVADANGAEQARVAHAAVRSMAASLDDCHTGFAPPRVFGEQLARLEGTVRFGGVGIRIKRRPEAPVVVWELLQGGSAEPSGVHPGDVIEEVDGQSVADLTLREVAMRIRGPVGSKVRLTIRRAADRRTKRYTLKRMQIREPVFAHRIVRDRVGYMRLYSFADGVDRQVVQALQEFEANGVQGWIIDLRTNGGGSLPMLLATLSKFLKQGPFAYYIDRSGQPQAYGPDNTYWPGRHPPLIILVSETTSSAAEVFATALRHYHVATVVGTRTSGCVGVGRRIRLSDGSGLTVKISTLAGPDGADLNRGGVEPDVAIEQTITDLAAGRDPQLAWALRRLGASSGRR